MKRAERRVHTQETILGAAVAAFARHGFEAASTRAIADKAGIAQGLLTYHFETKDELWRAAADRIFGIVDEEVFKGVVELLQGEADKEATREGIRLYVRFSARHPEILQFMIDAQSDPTGRGRWLVDNHLRYRYDQFVAAMRRYDEDLTDAEFGHIFYSMLGAGSLIFALGGEAMRLSGLDVHDDQTIEAHADFVAHLLVP